MIRISRGNVVLDVDETFLQGYLNQGYNVVDEKGNIIQRGTPNDVHSLKLALTEANKQIDKLVAENEALKDKINTLQKQTKKSVKESK